MYQSTGCGNSMLSNRLSWFFDLRGPSFSIDTACSSSMVALHEACRDILDGTTSMGVVAGSSLILVPNLWRALSSQRFLSPDGACHSFDSQANGYGRGEGFGVIIVKPLEDALRDNDVIRAVIRVSALPRPPRHICASILRKCWFASQHTNWSNLPDENRGAGSTRMGRRLPSQCRMRRRR